MPLLGLGEAAGELIEVTGPDQAALDEVIAWWQRPVAAGGVAVPDLPPRVLAPEPVKPGVRGVLAMSEGHLHAWSMITRRVFTVLAAALRPGPGSGSGGSAANDPSSPASRCAPRPWGSRPAAAGCCWRRPACGPAPACRCRRSHRTWWLSCRR